MSVPFEATPIPLDTNVWIVKYYRNSLLEGEEEYYGLVGIDHSDHRPSVYGSFDIFVKKRDKDVNDVDLMRPGSQGISRKSLYVKGTDPFFGEALTDGSRCWTDKETMLEWLKSVVPKWKEEVQEEIDELIAQRDGYDKAIETVQGYKYMLMEKKDD